MDCYLKPTKLLDFALIGVYAVIRSYTVCFIFISATFQNLDKEGHGIAAFDIDNVSTSCNMRNDQG